LPKPTSAFAGRPPAPRIDLGSAWYARCASESPSITRSVLNSAAYGSCEQLLGVGTEEGAGAARRGRPLPRRERCIPPEAGEPVRVPATRTVRCGIDERGPCRPALLVGERLAARVLVRREEGERLVERRQLDPRLHVVVGGEVLRGGAHEQRLAHDAETVPVVH